MGLLVFLVESSHKFSVPATHLQEYTHTVKKVYLKCLNKKLLIESLLTST